MYACIHRVHLPHSPATIGIIMRYLFYVHIFNQTIQLERWGSVVSSQNSIWCAHWQAILAHLEIVSMSKLQHSHMYPEGEVLWPRYFFICVETYFKRNDFILKQSVLMSWTTGTGDITVYNFVYYCSRRSMVNSLNQTMCWQQAF